MAAELLGFEQFIARLAAMGKIGGRSVVVGVTGRENSDLATVAAANEYGTLDGRIPSRPFMRLAMRDKRMAEFVTNETARQIRGEIDIETALNRIGAFASGLVKEKIGSNLPPPNAPATKLRKRSSKTLIDTGRLRQSIAWRLK